MTTTITNLPMDVEFQVWNIPHGTVSWTCKPDANGKPRPRLAVQLIDQYRYQREWTIELTHSTLGLDVSDPPTMDKLRWVSHMYQHPGRRNIQELSPRNAKKVMERVLHLVQNYPDLLFNAEQMEPETSVNRGQLRRPRHENFVHLAERILGGSPLLPSVLG